MFIKPVAYLLLLLYLGSTSCSHTKAISREEVNRKMEGREPYLVGAVSTDLRYELAPSQLEKQKELRTQKKVCITIENQFKYFTPFFRENFPIKKYPSIYPVLPTTCDLDDHFPPTATRSGNYYAGFITEWTHCSHTEK